MMSASDVGVLVIGQGTALNLDGIGIEEEEEVVDGDHHLQGEEGTFNFHIYSPSNLTLWKIAI